MINASAQMVEANVFPGTQQAPGFVSGLWDQRADVYEVLARGWM